jgi:hypothetical protein
MPRTKQLPEYPAPTAAELRALWRRYPEDKDVRRACMEIERLRGVVDSVDDSRASIERAWKDEIGGQLAGLHRLRLLLADERRRAGRSGPDAPDPVHAASRQPVKSG